MVSDLEDEVINYTMQESSLRSGLSKDVFDVQFVLKLPKLKIDKWTERLIRNMLAFEQCRFENRYLNEYILF